MPVLGWLRGAVTAHHHATSFAAAVVAPLAALGAVLLSSAAARHVLAIVAVLSAGVYVLAWVPRAPTLAELGRHRRRDGYDRFLIIFLTGSAAFLGGLIGSAAIVGWMIGDRETPTARAWYVFGFLVVMAAAGTLATWFVRSFARYVWPRRLPRTRTTVVAVAVLVAIPIGLLAAADVAREFDDEGRVQARIAGAGEFDMLIVIDPADPVSRALVRRAAEAVRAGNPDEVFPRDPGESAYSVRYGLAIPRRLKPGQPLWDVVPPAAKTVDVAKALAAVELPARPVGPASGAYGRILADALDEKVVPWRRDAQRSVAFVLERLPTRDDLDRYVPEGARGAVIPRLFSPADACSRFLDGRPAPVIAPDRGAPVRWGDALAAHCMRLDAHRRWEQAGRLVQHQPPRPIAVDVFTAETRTDRDLDWATWVQALGGRFDRPPFELDAGGRARGDAALLLRDARDVHTGVPVGGVAQIAEAYRPYLMFDGRQRFFPIDVDYYLSHPPGGEGAHEVCDHRTGPDDCAEVARPQDLVGKRDEYLNFAGGAKYGDLGEDARREDAPGRMYVHVRERGDRIYLGYWWFLRFNVTPWLTEVNCLPGLTFKESCHDHEGDWEGVTVVLRMLKRPLVGEGYRIDNLIPEAVVFDGHGRNIRWEWEDVELASRNAATYSSHPVVYPAFGSHASYPAPCRNAGCDQRLSNQTLGEGRHDGAKPWEFNTRVDCDVDRDGEQPCLAALPATRDGTRGTLWNAFPGRWGSAQCTAFVKFCALSDGPRTPSNQGRFTQPWSSQQGRVGLLRARLGAPAHRRPPRKVGPRWPPYWWNEASGYNLPERLSLAPPPEPG